MYRLIDLNILNYNGESEKDDGEECLEIYSSASGSSLIGISLFSPNTYQPSFRHSFLYEPERSNSSPSENFNVVMAFTISQSHTHPISLFP